MWNLIQTARWGNVPAWDLAKQSNFWYWWYTLVMQVDQDLATPPVELDAHQLAAARTAEAAGVVYQPSPTRTPASPGLASSPQPLTLEPAPTPDRGVFRPTLPVR